MGRHILGLIAIGELVRSTFLVCGFTSGVLRTLRLILRLSLRLNLLLQLVLMTMLWVVVLILCRLMLVWVVLCLVCRVRWMMLKTLIRYAVGCFMTIAWALLVRQLLIPVLKLTMIRLFVRSI